MKFSIIIPCYNAEQFVDRSIASAVYQNFDKSEYEIIVVNDASTDNTLAKLNEWKDRYPELVKVITYEENLRQGGARNAAMRDACGEYVCFLDADDRYDINCLLNYDKLIQETKADMVVTSHRDESKYVDDLSEYECSSKMRGYNEPPSVIRIFDNNSELSEIIASEFGYVWCSAYKRNIIIDNDIFFPEKLAYEDIYWPRIYELYAGKICVSDVTTYYRYDNPTSTMNKKNASHHLDRLTVYEILLSKYEALGVLNREYRCILNQTFEKYYFNSYYMFFTRMDDIPDVYARIRRVIYHYFPDWEVQYDDSSLPMYFQYMVKLLKKAVNMSPSDMLPFKESLIEILKEKDE